LKSKVLLVLLVVVFALSLGITGCTGGVGKTQVSVNLLIRTEDERKDMGDYLAGLLEDLGFKVTRQYGTSSDLTDIWLGDPALGTWNAYTGGWQNTGISRDEGGNFGMFYTPLGNIYMGSPLWAAFSPTEDFLDVCTALWTNDFTSIAERNDLFADAVPMSLEDSVELMLVDRAGFSPLRGDVALAADGAAGIEGSWMWAPTIHYNSETGVPIAPDGSTTLRVATNDLLTDPWNPIGGSNWAYDRFPQTATADLGLGVDTNNGLRWPWRIEGANVTVWDQLPVGVTSPDDEWLNLDYSATNMTVPSDAWCDWDAETQQWITVGEKFPGGVTAMTKTVVYYPEDIFDVPLHDGSTLSPADFLLSAIIRFDRAKEDSPIYDESYVSSLEALLGHFKGVTFDFDEPGYGLVVTTYDDQWSLDAEWIVGLGAWGDPIGATWYPSGPLGPCVWHNIALGMLADEAHDLAFSKTKATALTVDWMSFIAGPSQAILSGYLGSVLDSEDDLYEYIPYENVLGAYVTGSDALDRYQNLKDFYDTYGTFWVGSGPFYLYDVDTTGKVIQLKKFAGYPDDGDEFFYLLDPAPTEPVPSITGAWVDDIVMTVATDASAAVTQIQGDQLDVYAYPSADADLFAIVQADENLGYYESIGTFNVIQFNPVGPVFEETGKVNPFALPEVREAINWAVDRDYIVGDIMGGLGFPRFTAIGTHTGDAVTYADLIADIETEYATDFDTADAAIETAMLTISGVTREGGKYYYTPPE
jgi:peptide/nickel transport system substrate-binding protein